MYGCSTGISVLIRKWGWTTGISVSIRKWGWTHIRTHCYRWWNMGSPPTSPPPPNEKTIYSVEGCERGGASEIQKCTVSQEDDLHSFLGLATDYSWGISHVHAEIEEHCHLDRYFDTIVRLHQAIKRKRPRLLSRGMIFLRNTQPHIASFVIGLLNDYGWYAFAHSPHSSDLTPSHFHLF